MQSLKLLADTNMEISKAREGLSAIKKLETEYLAEREKKVIAHLETVLEESKGVVRQTKENHDAVKNLLTSAQGYSEAVLKGYEDFKQLVAAFEERDIEWERDTERTRKHLEEEKKVLSIQKITIDQGQEALTRAWEQLAKDQRKLAVDRGTLARAIERLKKNKI